MISGEAAPSEHSRPAQTDTSSAQLQVLATEHWSLLATRSLTYTESFSRVSMFLGVLTSAVVALALLAQVDQLHQSFDIVAILVLAVVIFVGLTTVGRLAALNRDDSQWVMGMNRMRRAYLDLYPELEPYFTTGRHDDTRGIMLTMNMDVAPGRSAFRDWVHGFQTLPATVGVITSVVGGVWVALVAGSLGLTGAPRLVLGVAVFMVMTVGLWLQTRRHFFAYVRSVEPRFPSEPPPPKGSSV